MKKQISIRGIYTKHMKKINVCAQVQKHPQNQMHTKTSETSKVKALLANTSVTTFIVVSASKEHRNVVWRNTLSLEF